MADRPIVYPGAIPQDSDLLSTNRNLMIALGYLAQTAWGTGTVVAGLPLTQTTVASMSVVIGPGIISYLTSVDPNPYGSLLTDSDALVKVGINTQPTTITLTAPGTSGYTTNYLIEASFSETDVNPVVLPYYNASNPAIAYSGPSNTGTAQNTTRKQVVNIQVKSGTPAPTGSQTTPAVDSGFVGLYVIPVNNGQTSITTAQMGANGYNYLYSGAPFISQNLAPGTFRTKLMANLNLYVSATGNDSNIGTSAFPFLTIQAAVNYATSNYDFNGYVVTINVGAGSFNGFQIIGNNGVGGGNYIINGAGSSSTTITSSAANSGTIIVQGASACIQNVKITNTGGTAGAGGNGIFTQASGYVSIGSGVNFGAVTSLHMLANQSGTISTQTSSGGYNAYTVSGGGYGHIGSSLGGYMNIGSSVVTISGTPAFNTFCTATLGGVIYAIGATFSGSATGVRYGAIYNGIIECGGGATFFPGNSAGSTSSQGLYV